MQGLWELCRQGAADAGVLVTFDGTVLSFGRCSFFISSLWRTRAAAGAPIVCSADCAVEEQALQASAVMLLCCFGGRHTLSIIIQAAVVLRHTRTHMYRPVWASAATRFPSVLVLCLFSPTCPSGFASEPAMCAIMLRCCLMGMQRGDSS